MKEVWSLDQVVRNFGRWNMKWLPGSTISFTFPSGPDAFTIPQQAAARDIFGQLAQLLNLRFVEVAYAEHTNNMIALVNWSQQASMGRVNSSVLQADGSRMITDADVLMGGGNLRYQDPWVRSSFGYSLLMHEIGHVLGLAHPTDYPPQANYERDAAYFQDSEQFTVMSYFRASATGARHEGLYPMTYQLHDVAALQQMYGANTSTRTGDTVYGFNSNAGAPYALWPSSSSAVLTIWDAGGTDTVDLSGYSSGSRVDLREGAFSDAGGMTLNISIAHGARIENAVGGLGNDDLRGNALNNRLEGGGGEDRLTGAEGSDLLLGGSGGDVFVYGQFSDSPLSWRRSDGKKIASDYLPDFVSGVDKIDLSALDADLSAPGNQAFSFIGTNAFSGNSGELRYQVNHGQLELLGDVNGDGVADFMIASNSPSISIGDLIL